MKNSVLPHNHGNTKNTASYIEQLNKIEDFNKVTDIFANFGDTSRVRIFWLLCHCEECVINISAILNMSSPAISHHLKILKQTGLIVSRREGKEVFYTSANTETARLMHKMIEKTMSITCP